jgi:hypothetical protein
MITSVPGLSIVNSAHIVNASLVNETVSLAESALPRLMAAPDAIAMDAAGGGPSGTAEPLGAVG